MLPKMRQTKLTLTIMVIFQRDVRMNKPFMPKLVYFEPKALDYPLGKELFEKFSKMDVEIRHTTSHNQVRDLPGIMIFKSIE